MVGRSALIVGRLRLGLRCISVVFGIGTFFFAAQIFAQDTSTKRQVSLTTTIEAGVVAVEGYHQTSVVTVVPAITVFGVSSILRSRAAISRFESGRMSGYGDVYAGYQIKQLSSITLAVEGEAGVGTYRGKMSGHFFQSGIVMGMGEHIVGQLNVSHAFDTAKYTAVSGAVTTSLKMKRLAISPVLRFTHARERMFGQLLMETSYEKERLSLNTQLGMATNPSDQRVLSMRPSASIAATLEILQSVSVTLNASQLPPDFARGMSASRQLSLGIRLTGGPQGILRSDPITPSQTVWIQSERSDSLTCLMLRLSGASTVEVRGTFTGWKEMSMIKGKNGEWKLPVVLSTGVYSIAIRVDGGSWHAPSGLARAQDDFGDNYGLLVVR